MLKRMLAVLCCLFLLQGCAQEQKSTNTKETGNMDNQLLTATEKQDTEAVVSLLEKGTDINVTDSQGRTPVMIATYANDAETAKALINAGADVNIRDNIKNNPFLYAGAEGYIDILKMTIEAGADPRLTNRYGGTALIPAAEHGYVEVIEELLTQTKIDVNHINNLGWTALMEAIVLSDGGKEHQQVVQLLINHGADVNIPDNDDVTPLQHARNKGFTEIEQLLIKAGAK